DVPFVDDRDRVLFDASLDDVRAAGEPPQFEMAGPRARIHFDPRHLRCGIVTCGGLCPGLNDVIRAVVLALHYQYGVSGTVGFRYGYEGLAPRHGHEPLQLTPAVVSTIHEHGGTILASSRGNQDIGEMVDTLQRMRIGILFAVGGDGTLKGAHAITDEARRRGLDLAVIGIPKTIDNDISCIQTSFGFQTAVSEARRATQAAHAEAKGARNGVGLVKLMGRDSGFIAAFATLADPQVNFCLVPEVPFTIDGFLAALERRIEKRGHAVVVVAEGAGMDLPGAVVGKDASGNAKTRDVGTWLRDEIGKRLGSVKYIDPSYTIRSVPANPFDAAFCSVLGQNAVHAGMAGRTDMVVGHWRNEFTHVPIPLATRERKKIDPCGWLWRAVLAATGQPARME
ncbi:MAG: ATP-dependent 6-phosphofructokinase, partial [Planctomycetes bacterium]|nr:ATP-dependent 6-phosphofructokinase [Planctomycetota bacterium]